MSRRVAHLIDTGGPGGAETVFSELVERLEEDRWRSVSIVPGPGWLESRLRRGGHRVVPLSAKRSFDVGYLARLVRVLRSHRVDLLQTHLFGSAVYGNLAGRLCGIPVVSTFHGSVDVADQDPLQSIRFRIMRRPSSRTVFVSRELRGEILPGSGLRAGASKVIYNGVDPEAYSTRRDGGFRNELGVEPDEILVGAVGNIRPAKNYGLLLRTAAILREDSPPYRFVVVGQGEGSLLDELHALRSSLGLEDVVQFAGFREDVARVLADLDLYLLTSSSEGFSLTTVQALASELPVVATRCGGPEEIVTDGIHGVLVEPDEPEAMANAVRRLVRNRDEARRLGRAGRSMVEERFTIGRMVDRYERLYEESL